MNKYKNKTLYRLIPIKVTELLFFCQEYGVIFSGFVFCCFNIKNNDSVIVFYIIPSFTHSSLVLNLNEFLLNINAILKKVENQTVAVPQ